MSITSKYFDLCTDLRTGLREFIDRHFDLFINPETGFPGAIYLRVPGTSLATYMEWRAVNCGVAVECRGRTIQLWCGRLDVTIDWGAPSRPVVAGL